MTQNEGELDRVLRVVGGTALFFVAYTNWEGVMKLFFLIISVLIIASGFTGYSNLYKRFGITTTSKRIKALR